MLLGLPPVHNMADVEMAFRREARDAHPDRGGDPERFKALVESRRILLSAPAHRNGAVVVVDDSHRLLRLLARLWTLRAHKPPRVM
jgi:hypothetical protein